jgi:hypothetical protein
MLQKSVVGLHKICFAQMLQKVLLGCTKFALHKWLQKVLLGWTKLGLVIHKVTLSSPCLWALLSHPLIPSSFSGVCNKVKPFLSHFLINLSMKC